MLQLEVEKLISPEAPLGVVPSGAAKAAARRRIDNILQD
jgi:hypothetical protein